MVILDWDIILFIFKLEIIKPDMENFSGNYHMCHFAAITERNIQYI